MLLKDKKLIMFDMDGTLTEPYKPISTKNLIKLANLLDYYKVAIITGSTYSEVEKQILTKLISFSKNNIVHLQNLCILTCLGARVWKYTGRRFILIQAKLIGQKLAEQVMKILNIEFLRPNSNIVLKGSTITYTLMTEGTDIEKSNYDPTGNKRINVLKVLQRRLPKGIQLFISGRTSIDITQEGMDKGSAATYLMDRLKIEPKQSIYFGDLLQPYGSDYPMTKICDSFQITNKSIESVLDKLLGEKYE
jgi:HAD superfamily hydrolase (TIGR01484 family)